MKEPMERVPFWTGFPPLSAAPRESQRLRLATLTRLRLLSVAGQTFACLFVAYVLGFPFPLADCLALIALSLALNVWLQLRFRKSHRLSARAVALVLAFDIVQPAGLLYLTGGIHNPFAIFLIVPATIAAATQPPQTVAGLSVLAVLSATFLTFFHLPLPTEHGLPLAMPAAYIGGLWLGIVVTLGFATIYLYRVAAEARTLSDALGATELVLQREQHLSALDGLAAAAAHELGTPLATIALVSKEMARSTPAESPLREDIDLLVAQSERCRDILRRLASLSAESEEHLSRLPVTSLIEEASAPHEGFGVSIEVVRGPCEGAEPVMRRNPGVLYGLGNILENAVDFAASEVVVRLSWNADTVHLLVEDDGPGFSPEVLSRIGDPYMARREGGQRDSGGGLGLGLFIAKTLLERSGAEIAFRNRDDGRSGAAVSLVWPRGAFAGEGGRMSRAPEEDARY